MSADSVEAAAFEAGIAVRTLIIAANNRGILWEEHEKALKHILTVINEYEA